MSPLRTSAALAALSLSLTTYCATMAQPDIKQNPNLKMRHEITGRLLAFVALLIFTFSAHGTAPNALDIKLNARPRMHYEITIKVDNAPGPFDRVEGVVDYRVSNDDCVPLSPVTGATVVPEKRLPIVLTHSGGNVYKGDIHTDLLQDEDYYGKGVCHWAVVAASANLFVKKVDFSAPLFHDDLLKGEPVTRYYSSRSYATTQMERVDTGETDRSQYRDEANATFSVTVYATNKENHK